MNTITLFDTEFWTTTGAMLRHWGGRHDAIPHVMQIGAINIALTDGLPELERFDELIIPRDKNGKRLEVTPFFTELTHMTAEEMNNRGIELHGALQNFHAFSGGNDAQLFSYGGDERSTFLPSCFEQQVPFPFTPFQCHNIRHLYEDLGISAETLARYTSGQLAEGLGISMPETHHVHNALSDVESLLAVLRTFDVQEIKNHLHHTQFCRRTKHHASV